MAELGAQPTSIQSVYSWYTDDKLHVNRRYQRKLVWTLIEKQKLIESILKKYPIPAILIAERENAPGTYEIIDGLQRLHAIISFIENAFSTLDGRYFNLDYFPTAKSRAGEGIFKEVEDGIGRLSQKEVSTLLDYVLALSVMRGATESEINDVFGRINTYGHRLSDQERRQAGIQNPFSELVRKIGCTLRGDVSTDVLSLRSMPEISVDLPSMRHGYHVKAEEVFWVEQGILRSTDLRDSMDEQCIADVAASVITGEIIDRSKDQLDLVYSLGTPTSDSVLTSLDVYGADQFSQEFMFCVDEILKVCQAGPDGPVRLRHLVFNKKTTNPFPSVFAIVLMAFHELIVKEGKLISDYASIRKSLENLGDRIGTGQKATSSEERRKNVDVTKGLVANCFIQAQPGPRIYGNHATADIEALVRRSEIELSDYELKQGYLTLADKRTPDHNVIQKVICTICAIANNGPNRMGKVVIGVTDKPADVDRIIELDKILPKKVGKRFMVGVRREAIALGKTVEDYLATWKNAIKSSALSPALRDSVLASIDFNDFYGLGVIVITVPPQKEMSWVGDATFRRESDNTVQVTAAKEVAALATRF